MKLPFYNQIVLPWHYVQALEYGVKYKWPAKNLRVIGVTGTNGKTTTSFMIWKMLTESGKKCGLLTTVAWGGVGAKGDEYSLGQAEEMDARVLYPQIQHMTTESVGILDRRMRAIADAGAEFLVIEVTSHALAQFRILGVPIEVAVFTNLTHDHLDYHKTFANYRRAKGRLFEHAKNAVINVDDENGAWFADLFRKTRKNASGDIIEYGIQKGSLRATEVEQTASGVEYACGDMKIKTRIPGKFNVYNSLAALGVGKLVGLSDQEIENGIYALEAVEGRMTRVDAGQDFTVIVDYAHAPDALVKVYESLPKNNGGRIISVHGGAGQRDHSTRAVRGEILGKNSDIVIITEDDTRDENLDEIMKMFVEGAEKAGKKLNENLFTISDRAEAIRKAVGMAKSGDIVLILGKGHEKTILRPDGEYPFEDIKVAKAALEALER